jgi:magnesium transporter
MPIVASMGGIAGSQTLTLMIRGMAVGQVSNDNVKWLLNREFLATTLNGFLFALVVSAAAMVWFRDPTIGLVIAMALVINLTIASIVGTLLPLTLKRLNIDPALAGGVILLTTTDVVGFLSFLGLATYFYA